MKVAADAFEKYYLPFLYGDKKVRIVMGITLAATDTIGSMISIAYILLPMAGLLIPWCGHHRLEATTSLRNVLVLAHVMILLQVLAACAPLQGEPDKHLTNTLLSGDTSGKPQMSCCDATLRGFRQGLSTNLWMWHLMLQLGIYSLPELHLLILMTLVAANVIWGSMSVLNGGVSTALALYLIYLYWQKGTSPLQCFCSSFRPAHKDIEFAEGLKMDVYQSGVLPPIGLLLWVHGGGWVLGDRGTPNALVKAMVENHGWIVCSADYRSCNANTGVKLPQQIDDIKVAATWIRQHRHEFGAEDLELCLGGISAGAHLAVLASPDISPAALILSSGVYCVSWEDFKCRPTLLHLLDNHVVGSRDADAWRMASPISMAEKGESFPPTVVLHGTADSITPVTDSRRFAAAVKKTSKSSVSYVEVAKGPHGWDYLASHASKQNAHLVSTFVASASL